MRVMSEREPNAPPRASCGPEGSLLLSASRICELTEQKRNAEPGLWYALGVPPHPIASSGPRSSPLSSNRQSCRLEIRGSTRKTGVGASPNRQKTSCHSFRSLLIWRFLGWPTAHLDFRVSNFGFPDLATCQSCRVESLLKPTQSAVWVLLPVKTSRSSRHDSRS